jgi:hypothetical protein
MERRSNMKIKKISIPILYLFIIMISLSCKESTELLEQAGLKVTLDKIGVNPVIVVDSGLEPNVIILPGCAPELIYNMAIIFPNESGSTETYITYPSSGYYRETKFIDSGNI